MMRTIIGGSALLLGLALGAPAMAQGSGSATIDKIKGAGTLVCGVSTGVAGFSLADSKGVTQGIDADTCRAVAAAILGDGNKVRSSCRRRRTNAVHGAAVGRGGPAGAVDDVDAWGARAISG